MKRLLVATFLVVSSLFGGSSALAASGGGNADAAHMCQQGGYVNMTRTDGTGFKNAGECSSYAARGGALVDRTFEVAVFAVSCALDAASCRTAEHGAPHYYTWTGNCRTGAFTGSGGFMGVTEELSGQVSGSDLTYHTTQTNPNNGFGFDVAATLTPGLQFEGIGQVVPEFGSGQFKVYGEVTHATRLCPGWIL